MKFSEDDHFIQFLQMHQPQPPPAREDQETALMALLETHPQQSPTKSRSVGRVLWLVPTAIAAGVSLLWNEYKPSIPIPEFALEAGSATFVNIEVTTSTDEGLEAYLKTSWSHAFEPRSYAGAEFYGYTEMFAETNP
ncbi:MAG: hypothetical protein HC799_01440 [Limnothrix sp. RL_2_0]|nr:hypothetical protein [Limnothrix sp. RL_2_0]